MSFPPRFDSASASRWLPVACGTYVLVGGLVSLAGWAFDVPSLADWDRNGITIQPNAAVAAALTGLALTLLGAGRRRWTAGLGLAVLAIAGLTITEHLTGIDFGIDRRLLFGRTWGSAGTLSPGRMGPPGSVGWLLAGCALLAAAARGRRRRVVPLLGLVVLTLSGLSLVGYVVGAGGLYTVPGMTVIALQSSTFLFVSGLGLLTSGRAWDPMRTMFEDSAAGLLARRALPLAFVLPVTIAFLLRLGTAAGHYDAAMATALLVVIVIVMICAVLWWGVIAVRNRERALTEAHAQLTEAHASLGRSEARMNAFLKQLPMGVGMFDSAGRWIYGNPMLNRFVRLDRPASDPQQLARWRFFDQAGVPIARTDWPAARVLRGETVAGMEVLHTLEDGRQIWTRIIGAPFRDDDGRIRGAVAILQDIDEQKRAEEALASAERQLRLVTDHVPVLIAQCDTAGRYKFVNRAYAERLGVTPEQMVGRHFGEVLGPQAHAVVGQHVDQALAGRVVEFEIDVADPTGPRVMHVAYTPERDAQGTVVGLIAAIHDITERKRAEDAVREANVRKDHFLAMLAHELRNPLAPLVSSLAVLQRGAADPATVDRLLQTMERQVGLMVRLIDDLMDIGRLAFNKLSLQRSPTSLSSVVHDAIDACHPAIHAAGQRLEVTVPPSPVYVNVDAARLTQSLGNLLNNASKYSPPGGRIDLEVVVSGSDVIIRVSDVGIGIAPEVLPSMFEMFTQADASLERARGGLGLGLGLARQLVEMHGGTLTASSPGLGLGSSFVITLRGVVCRSAPPLPDAVPGRPLDVNRVLVVDDNDDAAVSLQLMLELHGLQVDVVHDGRQALAVAALHRPDAVLLDIGLPGLNGYDVCREMRRQPWSAGTRILAMTGWGLPEDRRRSLEAGFDDHLVKPVDYEALIKALRPGTDRPNSMSPRSQIDRLLH